MKSIFLATFAGWEDLVPGYPEQFNRTLRLITVSWLARIESEFAVLSWLCWETSADFLV